VKKVNKKIDLLVVFLLLGVTAALTLVFSPKPIVVFVLHLLTSSVYLSLREKKNLPKIFLAARAFAI